MPGCSAVTCGSAACFLLHADHGCDRHPAFLAPSSSRVTHLINSDAFRAARMRLHVTVIASAAKQSRAMLDCSCACAPRKEVEDNRSDRHAGSPMQRPAAGDDKLSNSSGATELQLLAPGNPCARAARAGR